MILVLDSSALITLARIGRLDVLRQFAAGTIHIPEAVYDEVVTQSPNRPGSADIAQARWITVTRVQDRSAVDRLQNRVGHGEAEAIVLAGELGADLLILDDATARRMAEAEGRAVLGLLGLLIHAKERGLINSIKPLMDDMVAAGFYIDGPLYHSILRHANEETSPSQGVGS